MLHKKAACYLWFLKTYEMQRRREGCVGWGQPVAVCPGRPWQPGLAHRPSQERAAEEHRGSPRASHRAPPGDRDRPKPGQDTSPAQWGPWPGRAGLQGAGAQPGMPGAGAEGPRGLTWGPGLRRHKESGEGQSGLAAPLRPWQKLH